VTTRPVAALAALLLALTLPLTSSAAKKTPPPPASLAAADSIIAAGGAERAKALKPWIESAPLADVVYVLRRTTRELGDVERPLLERALKVAEPSRVALRERLERRLAPLTSKTPVRPASTDRPWASVFRIAVLLPDSGAYAEYAHAVRNGAVAGAASLGTSQRAITVESWQSGEDDPGRAVMALDSASWAAGSVIGELLSGPTLSVAAGARYLGLPVVSPTAGDERLGRMGAHIFQVGPSGYERGATLARAMVKPGVRVGVLVSSSSTGTFAEGFAAAAEALGGTVAWRGSHTAGNPGFRVEATEITSANLQVLFWDGESRDGEALLRQLSRDRVQVQVCGGASLSPEPFHANSRVLLEGVYFIGDEWTLPPGLGGSPPSSAPPITRDTAATRDTSQIQGAPSAHEADPMQGLGVRGFLAGRALRRAIDGGALCPEEIRAALDQRRATHPAARALGFLDFSADSVTLPVMMVQRGTAVPAGGK